MNRFVAHLPLGLALALTMTSGCSLVVDGTLAGRGGADGGPMDAPTSGCGVASDGTRCSVEGLLGNFVCLAGTCVEATCGDGLVEERDLNGMLGTANPQEDCDDGNDTDGDGCDSDCVYSCEVAEDCDDALFCNGEEDCDEATNTCFAGTPEINGTACTVDTTAAMCMEGVCRSGVCPDGTVDPGEECDDSNSTDDDGCDADCTFSCTTDTDCQDADACTGNETCDLATHSCRAGMAPDCDDGDPCTDDGCDSSLGCVFDSVYVDMDGDGFTAARTGSDPSCLSDDCNDASATAYPGAPETCGAGDLNCDGSTATPSYYPDCDGDGFAAMGAAPMPSCTPPTGRPPSCGTASAARWTSREPRSSSTTDCADAEARAYPGNTAYYGTPVAVRGGYDFNCDGAATPRYPVGRPLLFVECNGSSCAGTSYIVPSGRATSCGRQSSPFPELSHCERILLLCNRVEDDLSTIECR